jgi:adenylate cyclase class 2
VQEIEIKFRVENLEDIKSKLLSLGCFFSEELNQKDTIFVPNLKDTSTSEGKMFIRIRSVNGKVELTLKRQSSILMQSKEVEFEASDFDSAYDFLDTLGLEEWVTVEKKRITTKYKNFNICIDEVKKLGNFIEIEIVTEEKEKTKYYEEEIIMLAKELGINTEARVNSHYDTMIDELNQRQ